MPSPATRLPAGFFEALTDLPATLRPQLAAHGTVYVAAITQPDGTIDLEIEVSDGTIGAVLATRARTVERAAPCLAACLATLAAADIAAAPTRAAWDALLAGEAGAAEDVDAAA